MIKVLLDQSCFDKNGFVILGTVVDAILQATGAERVTFGNKLGKFTTIPRTRSKPSKSKILQIKNRDNREDFQTRIVDVSTGSFGIAIPVTTDAPFCVQRHVAILKSISSSPTDFLLQYLRSPPAKSFAEAVATGIAQKTVTLGALREMPIALPPLAEQHRIAAKVDELMALCDHLKADLAESRSRQARLSAILIESALQAA